MWPAAVLVAALGVVGHARSQGKSEFRLDATGHVDVRIELSELDLPELCNVDFSVADRGAQEARLTTCLEQGMPRMLYIKGDGAPCPVRLLRWEELPGSGPLRDVAILAESVCRALPEQIAIDFGLFASTPLDHVTVATLFPPNGPPVTRVLSKRASRLSTTVAHPLPRWLALPIGGGVVAIAALAALVLVRRRSAARKRRARGADSE